MPKKPTEYIHILCRDRAFLEPINIMGPIVQPLKVTKKAAVAMLMNGATLYEYDIPTKKTLKLTLTNINDPNRYATEVPTQKIPEPVTPVIKSGVTNMIVETPEVTSDENVDDDGVKPFNVDEYEFTFNENGTVNESTIPWTSYTKEERKALHNKIRELNAAAKK